MSCSGARFPCIEGAARLPVQARPDSNLEVLYVARLRIQFLVLHARRFVSTYELIMSSESRITPANPSGIQVGKKEGFLGGLETSNWCSKTAYEVRRQTRVSISQFAGHSWY
jgi:hypothetical protein